MENPNATWNDFSTQIIHKDVSFQVSSNFLNDEEQTKAQLATLGQESTIGTTRTPSQCCRRKFSNSRPKPKRKTK